jgi:hypothetical protein
MFLLYAVASLTPHGCVAAPSRFARVGGAGALLRPLVQGAYQVQKYDNDDGYAGHP